MTNRSGTDSSGILPTDRDMWDTVDEQDGTISAQKFIVNQLNYYAREQWLKLAVSLSADEVHALVYAWSTVGALKYSLGALGGVHGTTWEALEERARATLASLQMRRLLVVREGDAPGQDVRYRRTSAAKMVAALLDGLSELPR